MTYADITTDKPSQDPKIVGDAFKTLFVARLAYNVTPDDLEREFGRYGPIENVSKARHSTLCCSRRADVLDPNCRERHRASRCTAEEAQARIRFHCL